MLSGQIFAGAAFDWPAPFMQPLECAAGPGVTFRRFPRIILTRVLEGRRTMTQGSGDRLRIEAAQRDPSRFGELYEENFYRVYAYVARRVGNRHQAEDLTADVFREALASIGNFEWRGVPFAAWLLRIASRAIADHFQRLGREAGNPACEPDRPA